MPTASITSPTKVARDAGKEQLRAGFAYESGGRFGEAETAYLKALDVGGEDTRKMAVAALERVIRRRVEAGPAIQLKLGEILEQHGRFADAEAAYGKALENGTAEMRSEALVRLKAVIEHRQRVGPEAQLKLGQLYEGERRLADAEAAYAKALETGTQTTRADALRRATAVIERRESFYEKYLLPALDTFVKVAIPALLVLVALALARRPLKWYGRRRHKNALAIAGFPQTSGGHAIGSGFGETLAAVHERLVIYFRPRSVLGTSGKMPALLRSQSDELVELVSVASVSAVPFAKWLVGVVHQPAYRITGSTESTWRHIKVRAKLEHAGATVAQWSSTYPLSTWFVAEQDLAYEILLRLKEHSDARAS